MKAIDYNESTQGADFEYIDIPADLVSEADKWRNFLVEEVSTYDDTLMEKYVNEEKISSEEIRGSGSCLFVSSCILYQNRKYSTLVARRT